MKKIMIVDIRSIEKLFYITSKVSNSRLNERFAAAYELSLI